VGGWGPDSDQPRIPASWIDGRFPAHASKLSTLPANSYLTGTNSSNQNSMAVCETPNLYNRDVEYTLIIEYTVNMSMTF